eukprot:11455-Eustigmatos_ZCMA.PRE.1
MGQRHILYVITKTLDGGATDWCSSRCCNVLVLLCPDHQSSPLGWSDQRVCVGGCRAILVLECSG